MVERVNEEWMHTERARANLLAQPVLSADAKVEPVGGVGHGGRRMRWMRCRGETETELEEHGNSHHRE